MTTEKDDVEIDLGPVVSKMLEIHVQMAMKEVFAKGKVEALTNKYIERAVQIYVDEQIADARSGWFSEEMKRYVAESVIRRMSGEDMTERIDKMIKELWRTYSTRDSEYGLKRLNEYIQNHIRDRLWKLSTDRAALDEVDAIVTNEIRNALSDAAKKYAGRGLLLFTKRGNQ